MEKTALMLFILGAGVKYVSPSCILIFDHENYVWFVTTKTNSQLSLYTDISLPDVGDMVDTVGVLLSSQV